LSNGWICGLFWNPSCTNFLKHKSVLDDSMSGTVTDTQKMHHFIDSHLSIIQNHGTDLFSVFLLSGCGRTSWPFIIGEICGPFLNMVIHSYMLSCCKALFPYYAEILRWISAHGTNSTHKIHNTPRCSSLVNMEKERLC
jgi:hypothetical protein